MGVAVGSGVGVGTGVSVDSGGEVTLRGLDIVGLKRVVTWVGMSITRNFSDSLLQATKKRIVRKVAIAATMPRMTQFFFICLPPRFLVLSVHVPIIMRTDW